MRLHSLVRRRPSPAIVISVVALFMSLGGAAYAATQLPANSVGGYQLRNNAVSYKKIVPGSVGDVRADTKQLQQRVGRTCASNSAISAIAQSGTPTCTSTLPATVGTTSNTVSVPTTSSSPIVITTAGLTSGATYLGFGNPTITVSPAAAATGVQRVTATCTLTVGSNTQTRSATVSTASANAAGSESIPLQLSGTGGSESVSCQTSTTDTPAPSVTVTSAVNAIQVS